MQRRMATAAAAALLLAITQTLPTSVSADTAPAISIGEGRTVSLISSPGAGHPSGTEPVVRVLSADERQLQLSFELPALNALAVDVGGERFDVLEIPGGGVIGAVGEPMLPTFSRLIQIPAAAGVTCEVTGVETTELVGYRPIPMQPEEGGQFAIDRDIYAQSGLLGGERASVGQPAIARDLRVVPVAFHPVHYDPARDLLEVASRITVQVRFAGSDLRNAMASQREIIPPSFDRLYRSLVVNYQGPREDQHVAMGMNVIICPDEPGLIESLEPLIEWRSRKGFEVYLATTAQTGSTNEEIKAWLQNAYDTWENPPEYITLIGDADGWIALPCWYYSGGETDHPYVQLDGDDILPEAHIGRISVADDDQLDLYIHKIVSYESTPYMDETDWYTRACLVGDPGASGISCVQIMQWLKDRLLDYGYTEVDTVFQYPWVSQMSDALNRGDTIFSYRGYYGHSGWTTGDIFSLTNGPKMPFALSITCGTGDFAGATSYSEAWIRAGSPPDYPNGGIAAVATATLGTHTRYNNCVTYGTWRGVYWEDLYSFGEALTRAKLELYINYVPADPPGCYRFTHWNNLMGDPAGEIWTAVPRQMSVSHPAGLAIGASAVPVTVTNEGRPIAGAYVCVRQEGEVHRGDYTRTDGAVAIAVPPLASGELQLTVTKHDHHPYLATLPIVQEAEFVGYADHLIDDDTVGTSSGNGDGLANPGERLELPVKVQNYGSEGQPGVIGLLSSDDPYVTIIDGSEEFGDLPAGASSWSADDFDILIDGGAPHGHLLQLSLDLQSGANSWPSLLTIPITAPELVYDDLTVYGVDGQFDPGETGELSVMLRNVGAAAAENLNGTLVSESSWLLVTDDSGYFGNIPPGGSGENSGDRFGLQAMPECLPGYLANLRLHLESGSGARDSVDFVLVIGSAASSDPTGPDAHGYVAYDNTDLTYEHVPLYDWVEIAPNYGGPGEDVGLEDFGGADDDSRTVALPFPFVYYGETFSDVTICSNGWMAMGSTRLTNRRNWNIPAAGAPPYLIAPMWDNLYQQDDNRVYHWYDETNHRYIVQWSRVRNYQGGAIENFEVILFDPAHHPTSSGDGEILFQYDAFSNSDWLQHYCTVGIENADQTDGVLYTYFNNYNAGAAGISPSGGHAIKFTPSAAAPRGTLLGTVTNASNGETPIDGVSVRLLESGVVLTSEADGSYRGSVEVGLYTVVADHLSFAPDTVRDVLIVTQETTELDFSLIDILPPVFSETTILPDCGDDEGPYEVTSLVSEYSDLVELSLYYNAGGSGWEAVPLDPLGGLLYGAEIPGQLHGSLIKYYLYGEDVVGLAACDPSGAPWEAYEFWVLAPFLRDDMEAGIGDWTHYVVTDGFNDQWHHTDERNHTPEGAWSWKYGEVGGGYYGNRADGALESAPMEFDRDATLTFWHWMDAQISGSYTGYAYDGGVLEISVDGGDWSQITPLGGYPYLIRHGSSPGPFPEETPVYSGTFDWAAAEFPLEGIRGSVRVRFRFGSDGVATALGWFIDDVEILPHGPGVSDTPDWPHRPTALRLHPARPNPGGSHGAATEIRFDLPDAGPVRLGVFDPGGRLICRLVDEALPAGWHRAQWDARDAARRPVGSGVYYCILEAARQRQSSRLIIVR